MAGAKFGGEVLHGKTGKVLTYRVRAFPSGNQATWDAEILLRGGRWHKMRGDLLKDVGPGTYIPAAQEAFEKKLAGLDIEALNKQYGN